ncbi:hypothetical protein [Actinopolyspora mortivallis]|uniref:hypothetical protein n=1 Tax=Actinopolyspora mortivallis TaxID=33906 RepID=UPI0012EED3A1|nr:hypothetical protein [Actinopolyspora mortivallis]
MPDSYLYLAIVASTVGSFSGIVNMIAGVLTIRANRKTPGDQNREISVTRTVKPHRRRKTGRKRGKHRRR